MKSLTLLLLILMMVPKISQGQQVAWKTYTAQLEDGPATISLNMDHLYAPPKREYPFLVVTGITTVNCPENGLPPLKAQEALNAVAEQVEESLSALTSNLLVGSVIYKCTKLDYFYTSDTAGIRQMLEKLYKEISPADPFRITLEADHGWETYLEFLYPNDLAVERIANREVLEGLIQAGDKLIKPRAVDHWLYFPHESVRKTFVEYAKAQGFKIKKNPTTKGDDYPFGLMISRRDLMDINSISKLTLQLKNKAHSLGGVYDGWETHVVLD